MIHHFEVKNYKCLQHVSIPLTPFHVLIGQNDSGKSSLLEAMLALSRSTEGPLTEAFPGEWQGRELVFEGAERPVIEFGARLDEGEVASKSSITYHLEVEFLEAGRECRRVEEWCQEGIEKVPVPVVNGMYTWSGVGYRTHVLAGPNREKHDAIADLIGKASLYRLDPKIMAIPAVADVSRKFRMDPDGFGLPTLLVDIVKFDTEKFVSLQRDFIASFPQFRRVRTETQLALSRQFQPSGKHIANQGTGEEIILETTQGRSIRAQQASDGAILFLGLLALIHSPEPPSLLLFEEPEKGVYPKRLAEVIGLLRRLQEVPSGQTPPQIIITTHSPYVLALGETRPIAPEEVTFMMRQDGSGPVVARPLRKAPNIQERLGGGEFYLGELWYNLTEEELFADA